MRLLNSLKSVPIAAAIACMFNSTAHAAWTVTSLNPSGSPYSFASTLTGTEQGGSAMVSGAVHASMWTGTAGSRVDLHPGSQSGSQINAISLVTPNRQVGYTVDSSNIPHAAKWSGTSGSWVDIHPSGTSMSEANAVDVNIAGTALVSGENHAWFWPGSGVGPSIDLNPSGAVRSAAHGVSSNYPVGSATFGSSQHAGWWTISFIPIWNDLNPSGATSSVANGIDASFSSFNVVGSATFSGNPRASLWTNTLASSWVDLNPASATTSVALATYNGQQVGSATFSGTSRASFWNGSAATWEDLSLVLPGSWSSTVATGIWSDGSNTYVSGYGVNNATSGLEALLWSQPTLPEPTSLTLLGLGSVVMLRRRRA